MSCWWTIIDGYTSRRSVDLTILGLTEPVHICAASKGDSFSLSRSRHKATWCKHFFAVSYALLNCSVLLSLALLSFSTERAHGRRSLIHAKQAVLGRESKKKRETEKQKKGRRRKKKIQGRRERARSWHNEHACLCPTSWRAYLYLDESDAWVRDRWSSKLREISSPIALLVDLVEILTFEEKRLSTFLSLRLSPSLTHYDVWIQEFK